MPLRDIRGAIYCRWFHGRFTAPKTAIGIMGRHNMDKTEKLSQLRAQLVQLIIQQGTIFTNWIKFAITVQAGLAAGFGFVVFHDAKKYWVLGLLVAFFGLATAVLFAWILYRHAQWAAWYLGRGNDLPTTPELSLREPGFTRSEQLAALTIGGAFIKHSQTPGTRAAYAPSTPPQPPLRRSQEAN
jgi:hypothetical protein